MEWSIKHHANTYSVLAHTLDLWGWVKRSKHFFSEYGYVAFQTCEFREFMSPATFCLSLNILGLMKQLNTQNTLYLFTLAAIIT